MTFAQNTKARMFIKCGRLCCLCLKQCGVNIEAAHIVDENKGGSNDESNGIPVCFDCHQEIGAYDPKHPKGNKFTEAELKAHRDRVYALVESGVIHAQVVARQAHSNTKTVAPLPGQLAAPEPSGEGKQLLQAMLDAKDTQKAPGGKLKLLSTTDRAYVLDQLVKLSAQVNKRPKLVRNSARSLKIDRFQGYPCPWPGTPFRGQEGTPMLGRAETTG